MLIIPKHYLLKINDVLGTYYVIGALYYDII